MKTLYIIRGLPGSGKSTLATKLVSPGRIREADMFFVDRDGEYRYDPSRIKDAHDWCKKEIERLMQESDEDCAVANTMVLRKDYFWYVDFARRNGFQPQIIECHGQWKNVHGVPDDRIESMRKKWQRTILK